MLDLVTAGEAFDDFVFYALDRLPKPGEELKTDAFRQTCGGGAVITAVAAARLGLRCAVASGLSGAAIALLEAEGVRAINLRRRGEPPALSVALSTRHDRAFVTFNGMNGALPPRIAGTVTQVRARHVHFAFYPRPCARWVRVVEALRRIGTSTSWDFGWNPALVDDRGFDALAGAVDFLFVNRAEAVCYARARRLSEAVARWRKLARCAIVKLGADGSRAVAAAVDLSMPAPRVRAVDTTGAGDAFNAGFIATILRGLPLARALRAGNRVGALSTMRAGGIDGLPRARASR